MGPRGGSEEIDVVGDLGSVFGDLGVVTGGDLLRDDGGKPVSSTAVLRTDNPFKAVMKAVENNIGVLPFGSLTSAVGAFSLSADKQPPQIIAMVPVGLDAQRIVMLGERHQAGAVIEKDVSDLGSFKTNEIRAGEGETGVWVEAGSGVTIAMIEQYLKLKFPDKSLSCLVNPTTFKQVSLAAALANGSMGPNRLTVADLALEADYHDGNGENTVSADQIREIQGNLGLAGVVNRVRIRAIEVPKYRHAFLLPVQGSNDANFGEKIGEYLANLEPFARLSIDDGHLNAASKPVIDGMEVIAMSDLRILADDGAVGQQWRNVMEESGAEYGVLILLRTDDENFNDSDLAGQLYDDEATHSFAKCLRGFDLHGLDNLTFFSGDDFESVLTLREKIPETARSMAKNAVVSMSTDFNLRIKEAVLGKTSAEKLQSYYQALLKPYVDFVNAVVEVAKAYEGELDVSVHKYGHLSSPMNLHTRVTASAIDGGASLRDSEFIRALKVLRDKLQHELSSLTEHSPAIYEMIPGEKGPVIHGGLGISLMPKELRSAFLYRISRVPDASLGWRVPGYLSSQFTPLAQAA